MLVQLIHLQRQLHERGLVFEQYAGSNSMIWMVRLNIRMKDRRSRTCGMD